MGQNTIDVNYTSLILQRLLADYRFTAILTLRAQKAISRFLVLELMYYEGVSLRKAPLKPNTAAPILFISPLLASLCLAMPAQAAVQSVFQSVSQSISMVSSIQAISSPSFYQQQDKLKYVHNSSPHTLDFSFLSDQSERRQDLSYRELELAKDIAERENIVQTGDGQEKEAEIKRTEKQSIEKQSIKERFQQQIQTQKRLLTKHYLQSSSGHKNFQTILAAAREKHSPLQGRYLNANDFNTNQINIHRPDLTLLRQIPQKVDQMKADFQASVQQQPEQLKQAMSAAKNDLQQRSGDRISGPLYKLRAFIQHTVKNPLSRLLKKVSAVAQKAADQLQ